jgi:serine/threonine protein kinase
MGLAWLHGLNVQIVHRDLKPESMQSDALLVVICFCAFRVFCFTLVLRFTVFVVRFGCLLSCPFLTLADIFVDHQWHCYVADFGMARLIERNEIKVGLDDIGNQVYRYAESFQGWKCVCVCVKKC